MNFQKYSYIRTSGREYFFQIFFSCNEQNIQLMSSADLTVEFFLLRPPLTDGMMSLVDKEADVSGNDFIVEKLNSFFLMFRKRNSNAEKICRDIHEYCENYITANSKYPTDLYPKDTAPAAGLMNFIDCIVCMSLISKIMNIDTMELTSVLDHWFNPVKKPDIIPHFTMEPAPELPVIEKILYMLNRHQLFSALSRKLGNNCHQNSADVSYDNRLSNFDYFVKSSDLNSPYRSKEPASSIKIDNNEHGLTISHSLVSGRIPEFNTIFTVMDLFHVENTLLVWNSDTNPLARNMQNVFDHACTRGAEYLVGLNNTESRIYESCTKLFTEIDKKHQSPKNRAGSEKHNIVILNQSTIPHEFTASGIVKKISGHTFRLKEIIVADAREILPAKEIKQYPRLQSLIRGTYTESGLENNNGSDTETANEHSIYLISSLKADNSHGQLTDSIKLVRDVLLSQWINHHDYWHLNILFNPVTGYSNTDKNGIHGNMDILDIMTSITMYYTKHIIAEHPDHYKGRGCTPRISSICKSDLKFAVIVLETFLREDKNILLNHELARWYTFIKPAKEKNEAAEPVKTVLRHEYDHDDSPLARWIKSNSNLKKRTVKNPIKPPKNPYS